MEITTKWAGREERDQKWHRNSGKEFGVGEGAVSLYIKNIKVGTIVTKTYYMYVHIQIYTHQYKHTISMASEMD